MSDSLVNLTTVDKVKSWLSKNGAIPATNSDDDNINGCIAMSSATFLFKTGRGPQDGTFPEVSPFVQPVEYDEWYDGSGHDRMFLRNFPIKNVLSFTVGFREVIKSLGYGKAGWVISGDKTSIVMRGGGGENLNFRFGVPTIEKGVQNVHVVYLAGYDFVPPDIELAMTKHVALTYKRKDWIGLKSKGMGNAAGTTSYTDVEFEADVECVIDNHTRRWIV
jgi:hypothetical protein